jgi:NADPH-dependent ferric siderophore reductase
MHPHEIQRIRLEAKWRTLRVTGKHLLTPRMLRVDFCSDELGDFKSPSPDDHVKLLLPGANEGETLMRDFTPRAWDSAAGTFTIDFALHEEGPAVVWARHAQIGSTLQIGGPRGSMVVPDDFDWYLLMGDATALPAIARRMESPPPSVPITVAIAVSGPEEEYPLPASRNCEVGGEGIAAFVREHGDRLNADVALVSDTEMVTWLHTGATSEKDVELFREWLPEITLSAGDGFIWIAGEGGLSKALYRWAKEERQHPEAWIKVSEYWKRS